MKILNSNNNGKSNIYRDEVVRVEITDRGKINKRIAILGIPLIISLVLIITLGIQYYRLNIYSRQIADLSQKAIHVENDYKNNKDKINEEFTMTKLSQIFTKNDMYAYTFDLWLYEIYINDQKLTDTATFTVNSNNVVITLVENQKESPLPKSFIDAGRLTRGDKNDNISNYIFLSDKSFAKSMNNENEKNTYRLEKRDVKKGEVCVITLTDQLFQRLGFKYNTITIISK